MRVLLSLAFAAIAAPLFAQLAEPPAQAKLDRLGLKTEWVSAVPLTGERDGIASIQIADGKQVFVQTRGGLLVAFDAATGERQWSFRYDNETATPFAVAWNDRYVFAFSVIKLYGIQRITGVLDFTQNLPLAPTAPPIADSDTVYVVMAGNRVGAYILPAGLAMPDPALLKAANKMNPATAGNTPGLRNPADVVAGRYPGTARSVNTGPEAFEARRIVLTAEPAGSFGSTQRTASLAVAATLRPPYRAFDDSGRYLNSSPSLNALSSLRQPYHLADPTAKSVQRTPSLAAIPPSLASVYQSADLRPRGIELKMKWIFGSTVPIAYTPLATRSRIWGLTNTPVIVAMDRVDGATMVDARLSAAPTAQPGQAEDIAFVPQQDGYLVAVDLLGGANNTIRTLWKANVGGLMNFQPVPTKNGIYQSGSNAGIARIDNTSGEVVWRTDRSSDRILAVNDEHVYARDNHGKIYVFDRNRVSDAQSKRAHPLAVDELGAFNVTVTNAQTDRIFLAADSGMFVCLRDASPKYAVAKVMAPPRSMPPPPIPGLVKPAAAAPTMP